MRPIQKINRVRKITRIRPRKPLVDTPEIRFHKTDSTAVTASLKKRYVPSVTQNSVPLGSRTQVPSYLKTDVQRGNKAGAKVERLRVYQDDRAIPRQYGISGIGFALPLAGGKYHLHKLISPRTRTSDFKRSMKIASSINRATSRTPKAISIIAAQNNYKKGIRSVLYHEMGHTKGKIIGAVDPYSRKGISLSPEFKDPTKAAFGEEVRAWKNATDLSKGKGQKHRMSPVTMYRALKSYETTLGLPKGSAGKATKAILRRNQILNIPGNQNKKRGFAGSRRKGIM